MFGDELIIGSNKVKISDNGRIFLPPYTNATDKDKIVLKKVLVDNQYALKIYSFSKFVEIINRYKKLRDNATSLQEVERLTSIIERLCIQLNLYLTVDNQRRIFIPKTTRTSLGWNAGDQVELQGLGESLLVRKIYTSKKL